MIREDNFIHKMTARWEALGNCLNDNLIDNWKQLCGALNGQQEEKNSNHWQVIQAATGTGKTQGIAVYCSSLISTPACGVLIVVRLIKQAEEVAGLINELAGRSIAKAKHTDNRLSEEEIAATQVLVITHKAYELSLNRYMQGGTLTFERYLTYNKAIKGRRELTIIDECLNVVKQFQVDLEELKFALGAIPYHIKASPKHIENFSLLDSLADELYAATETHKTKWVQQGSTDISTTFNLSDLRAECRQVDWDKKIYGTESNKDKQKGANRIDTTLEAAEATLNQWKYYSKKGAKHTLNTSLLVVPPEVQGAVILDATASNNVVYELFTDRYVRLLESTQARSYKNVTLHIARVSGVGKGMMSKLKSSRTRVLMDYLSNTINSNGKVFICCHKAIEPIFTSYLPPFELHLGHWGAIDGLNSFQECDTFVGFGLPYRPTTCASNTFLAFKGPQSDEWLNNPSARSYEKHVDILTAISEGQMASDVIQAINRIKVRKVIDAEGNCAKSQGYLLLPKGAQGDRLIQAITKAMPDIKTQDWAIQFDEGKVPSMGHLRGDFSKGLLTLMKGKPQGLWSASAMQAELAMTRQQWRTVAVELRKPESSLSMLLAEIGCTYSVEGTGKQSRSYIAKEL